MEEKELKVLKLDEITELIWNIFIALFIIILIISFISGYGIWTTGAITVIFLLPVVCIISGILITILRKLNYVETDGEWSTLDLMKSFYSELDEDEEVGSGGDEITSCLHSHTLHAIQFTDENFSADFSLT